MAAHARKKMRAILSPDYQYQAMALTYRRPLPSHMAETVRQSPRTSLPARRRFAAMPDAIPLRAVPQGSNEKAETAHLPQSFRHGLPRCRLEPGTTDLQHPPSHLFPEPPLG